MRSSAAPTMLRYGALLGAFAALCQGALGFIVSTQAGGLTHLHAVFAYILTAAALWCTVWGWLASKHYGSKGLFFHALGMLVLSIVQIGLGEMLEHSDSLRWVHIIVGIAYVIGMIALGALALRGGDAGVASIHDDPAAEAAADHLDHAADNVTRTRTKI